MLHTRRIARFSPRRSLEEGPSVWQRVLNHGGTFLVTLASLVLAYGLWWAPKQLTANFDTRTQNAYQERHFEHLQRVERHWNALPTLPMFSRGDEPAVKAFLERQPLVEAVFDRIETRALWVREGDRLVKAVDSPKVQLFRAWITQAEVGQRFQWTPTLEHDPDHLKTPSTVILGDQWIVIKRWEIGSPRVEAALHEVFGDHAPVRVGMQRDSERLADKAPPKQPWGAEPHYQADQKRLNSAPVSFPAGSDAFGEGWSAVAIPWKPEWNAIVGEYYRLQWTARLVAVLVAAALAGGLWLRRRARQRAQLQSDRMAALTHSLKTPLAVLKFRCDSLRLGRLDAEQSEAELLRIGEEVEGLTEMIEQGLSAIRGDGARGPQRLVDAAWLMDVAEDIQPAFEADNRDLELRLAPETGKAALPSLRPALLTLLENALFHGGGLVVLETWRKGRRFFIRVSDQGAGVDDAQLEALGKPFMRFRREGKEGFTREGQGLGVSLLCQVAIREGWGLSFSTAPGKGFQATLILEAV